MCSLKKRARYLLLLFSRKFLWVPPRPLALHVPPRHPCLDADEPTRLLAGSQDQGYQRGHVVSATTPGPSTNMTQIISGDYGHLCSGDGTHSWVFSTYPGFVLVQQGESGSSVYQVSFPSSSQHLWLPPVVADPTDNQAFYFLGNRLWRYTRTSGQSWSHTQHSAQAFDSGGSSYLTAMAIAPSQSSRFCAMPPIYGI